MAMPDLDALDGVEVGRSRSDVEVMGNPSSVARGGCRSRRRAPQIARNWVCRAAVHKRRRLHATLTRG